MRVAVNAAAAAAAAASFPPVMQTPAASISAVSTPPHYVSAAPATVAVGKQHRTLDLEHSSALKRLGRDRAHAEVLRGEAALLGARIASLEGKPRYDLNDADFDDLKISRHRHDRVVADADDAESRGDEIDYFVRTGGILFRYYDIVDKGMAAAGGAPPPHHQQTTSNDGMTCTLACATNASTVQASSCAPSDRMSTTNAASHGAAPRSILSYFSPGPASQPAPALLQPTTVIHPPLNHEIASEKSRPQQQQQQQPQHKTSDDRASLFDRYLQSVDADNPVCYSGGGKAADFHLQQQQLQQKQQLQQLQPQPATSDKSFGGGAGGMSPFGTCGHCGSGDRAMQLQDGYVFCRSCQTVEYVLVDHEKPSYKDPPKEVAYFAYKRINHFNEWLNQVQGKETTEIPEEVYDLILLEIKKQKLTNMAMLSKKLVKEILKKLRINKFYEHIPHIINRLNGIPSPHLSPELEDKLRHMFCQIQVPFFKHAPSFRKNFLSYSFCLNKMMQLLEKDQYLDSFPLLKSREKLHQQDMIWQKICAEIGWDFIPSL
jgi:hypothetical protein